MNREQEHLKTAVTMLANQEPTELAERISRSMVEAEAKAWDALAR